MVGGVRKHPRAPQGQAESAFRTRSPVNWVGSHLPILDCETVNTAEFGRVVGDESEAVTKRGGSDHQVVRADDAALALEGAAQTAAASGAIFVEGHNAERTKEGVHFGVFFDGVGAAFGSVAQLVDDHGRKRHVPHRGGTPAGDERAMRTGSRRRKSAMQALASGRYFIRGVRASRIRPAAIGTIRASSRQPRRRTRRASRYCRCPRFGPTRE